MTVTLNDISNNFIGNTLESSHSLSISFSGKLSMDRVYQTRSSADADKPARRAYRSVKVTKHGTIRHL